MFNKVKPYIYSVITALAVGGLSALATMGNMDIYESINRPYLSPPPVVFPIVWSILFVLMGISSALVYTKQSKDQHVASTALKIYALQLIFNFVWSILFFNLQAYPVSFIWLVALWALILAMIIQFYKISKAAALLQIPYLAWVTFAGYLNIMIYILN